METINTSAECRGLKTRLHVSSRVSTEVTTFYLPLVSTDFEVKVEVEHDAE